MYIGADLVMKIRQVQDFKSLKVIEKNWNPKIFQKTPLRIVAEKLHAKYEGAAMIGSWLNVNLKLPLVASGQKND